MRILQVHNAYQIAGGEDVVVAAERELLQAHGHEVDLLAAANHAITGLTGRVQAAASVVYSRAAYRRMTDRISRYRPELVHIHNFFPLLSPSIHYACRAARVPVVQTLHNFRLVCPNALCFRRGQTCEDCLGKPVPWPGVWHGCYRGSRSASLAVATMIAVHRGMRTWHRNVAVYIALSTFARDRLVQGGLPAEKIVVKPNFVDSPGSRGSGDGGYALYVGRLSEEKGIQVILRAWEQVADRLPLRIVGDGPLREITVAAAERLRAVNWLGRLPRTEVRNLMDNATLLVSPSVCYENFPMAIVEAYAAGLPVLASDLGSQGELVTDQTGRHFQAGNPADLARQATWLLDHPEQLAAMRRAARAQYEAKYTPERNYQLLMEIYQQAIQQRSSMLDAGCS